MDLLLTWVPSTSCCLTMKGEGPCTAAASPPSLPCLPAQAARPCSPGPCQFCSGHIHRVRPASPALHSTPYTSRGEPGPPDCAYLPSWGALSTGEARGTASVKPNLQLDQKSPRLCGSTATASLPLWQPQFPHLNRRIQKVLGQLVIPAAT